MLSAVRIPFDIRIKRSVDTAAVIGKEQTRRGMICWATFIQHFATRPNCFIIVLITFSDLFRMDQDDLDYETDGDYSSEYSEYFEVESEEDHR